MKAKYEKLNEAYEYLRSLGKFHNKKKFAEEIGFDYTNLSSAFNGVEKHFNGDLFKKIYDRYPGIFNLEYFTKDNDSFPMLKSEENKTNHPVADSLPLIPFECIAGYGEDNDGIKLNECERYNIPEFKKIGAEFLIRVGGSSMYPKYASGDILACRKIHDILFFQWGKIYVIDSSQGQLIKRVCEHENPDMILLVSDNKEKYPPFSIPKSDIRSLSIVLGAVRME
ncbi:MAG: S24 family peptidase [Prevotellaceae bacterium]|jgi:phage repressor protein C with HTH and peptisase S24 domain|nr:S24 family peptidase [Prevotellaceae bacterium]